MKSSITNQPSLPVWKRRTAWLALIPALVILILCLGAMPQAQSSQANIKTMCKWAYLEGSWLVTVTVDIEGGPPPFESPVSYAAGGVVNISDPSVFPTFPMTTAYHGAWARKGPRDFVFTAIAFQYDTMMEPPVLWKCIIKETVVIEPGGDAYNGKGTSEWYAPDGTPAGSVDTVTHGIRIKAE